MAYNRTRYRRRRGNSNAFLKIIGVITLIAMIGFFGFGFQYMTEDFATITVNSKERIVDGESSYYLVYAEEGEYKVVDTLAYGKFNASSTYGKLKEGHRYKVRITGWRSGFWSMYPNIVEIIREVE